MWTERGREVVGCEQKYAFYKASVNAGAGGIVNVDMLRVDE